MSCRSLFPAKLGLTGSAVIFNCLLGCLEPLLEVLDGKDKASGVFKVEFFLLLALLDLLADPLGVGVAGISCGDRMLAAVVSVASSCCLLSHQVIFPWPGVRHLLAAFINFLGKHGETELQF